MFSDLFPYMLLDKLNIKTLGGPTKSLSSRLFPQFGLITKPWIHISLSHVNQTKKNYGPTGYRNEIILPPFSFHPNGVLRFLNKTMLSS